MDEGNFIANYTLEYHSGQTSIKAEAQGITLTRNYYKIVDKITKIPLAEDPVVKIGEVLLVELEAVVSDPLDYVVIEDGIPAGFLPVFTVNEYNLEGVSFYKNMAHHEFGRNSANFFFDDFSPIDEGGYVGSYYYLLQAVYRENFMPCPLWDTTCINRENEEIAAVTLYESNTNTTYHSKFIKILLAKQSCLV